MATKYKEKTWEYIRKTRKFNTLNNDSIIFEQPNEQKKQFMQNIKQFKEVNDLADDEKLVADVELGFYDDELLPSLMKYVAQQASLDKKHHYVIKIGQKYITLNSTNQTRFKDTLKQFVKEKTVDIIETSAGQIINEIEIYGSFQLEKRLRKKYTKKDGEFFRYKVKDSALKYLPFKDKDHAKTMLNDCQIYFEDQQIENTEQCFIYSIRRLGVDQKIIEKIINECVHSSVFTLASIRKISKEFDLHFNITRKTQETYYETICNKKDHRGCKKICVGLLENHYFPNDKGQFQIINSIKSEDLEPIDLEEMMEKAQKIQFNEEDKMIHNEPITKQFEIKKIKNAVKLVIAMDFETFVNEHNDHEAYQCSIQYENIKKTYNGPDCAKQAWFDILKMRSRNNIRVVFHNTKFDFRFLFKEMNITNYLEKDGQFYQAKQKGQDYEIEVIDFYKFMAVKLSKLSKIFDIKTKKEAIAYTMYNYETLYKEKPITLEQAKQYFINEDKEHEYETFVKNVKDNDFFCEEIVDDEIAQFVNLWEYSQFYCEHDVDVLYQSYYKFKELINDNFKIDIDNFLTISSVADYYLQINDCYEKTQELTGICQNFISKCAPGGRTMTMANLMIKCDIQLQDFDAVSLYPSAMYEMPGFIMGTPKIIQELNMDFLNKQTYYFVKIRVTKVNEPRLFPIISQHIDGKRVYDNQKGIYFVDKITLEDAIEYMKIEFDILEGYYFDEGFNDKVNNIILKMFQKRYDTKIKMKQCTGDERNSLDCIQEMYKLMMNSSYGKNGIKVSQYKVNIHHEDRGLVYINNNFNMIHEYQYVGNKIFTKEYHNKLEHFNRIHQSAIILSQSKRIMNRVMCLAEDNDIIITYTDTDSMHIDASKIDQLSALYKQKYDKELIGSQMGQFHTDFSSKKIKDPISIKSIFCGKKNYMDVLSDTEQKILDYHVRAKGIPQKAIDYYCKTNNCTPYDIYVKLFDGEEVEFDLVASGAVIMKFTGDYKVKKQLDFKRKISFKGQRVEISE